MAATRLLLVAMVALTTIATIHTPAVAAPPGPDEFDTTSVRD